MVRTQVYLQLAQKRKLNKISLRQRVTVSKLIRQAVDQFLAKSSSDFEEAIEKGSGLWGRRKDFGSTSTYVRKVRRDWEKRGKRTPAQVLLDLAGSWHDDRPAEKIVREIRRCRREESFLLIQWEIPLFPGWEGGDSGVFKRRNCPPKRSPGSFCRNSGSFN